MSTEKINWHDLIEKYKSDELSQVEFCKTHSLSYNQCQYQYKQYHKNKREISKLTSCAANAFESVAIKTSNNSKSVNHALELTIHLPNQICCEVRMDSSSNVLSALLKELACIC